MSYLPFKHTLLLIFFMFLVTGCSQKTLLHRAEQAYDQAGPFVNSNVTIEATGGVVTVRGTVGSQQDRNEIDIVMADALGQDNFTNELKVVRAPEGFRDTQLVVSPIAVEAFKKIQRLKPEGLYEFKVRQIGKSRLLLEGEVESSTVRKQVEEAVLSARGVTSVENDMTMRQYPSGAELYELVRDTLVKNKPALALRDARMRVEGSRVILGGEFPDHQSLDHVLSVIRSVQGVEEIDNRSRLNSESQSSGLY